MRFDTGGEAEPTQAGVLRKTEDELNAIVFAPGHDRLAAESIRCARTARDPQFRIHRAPIDRQNGGFPAPPPWALDQSLP
ncbi:MAG: hypothetical protein U9Q81_03345 [Pseudomonadota bacterium]|nr:hypothetical protein [Pseudomonadota bacterium]